MIEVKNIKKSFNGTTIIENISTSFEKGKTNLIIGQSGSGKTVLLKCLLGLHHPDSGEIIYDGVSSLNMNESNKTLLRREMGMVFQGSALFDSMTVEENIMFPMQMFTQKIDEEILETKEQSKPFFNYNSEIAFNVTNIINEAVSEVVNRYLEQKIQGVYILQLIWGNNSQQLKLLRE